MLIFSCAHILKLCAYVVLLVVNTKALSFILIETDHPTLASLQAQPVSQRMHLSQAHHPSKGG